MGQIAHADPVTYETFVFTGTCPSCTGTGLGVLTLTNYTLGDAVTTANFVSFVFSSSDLSTPAEITAADLTRFTGSLGEDGAYAVKIRKVGIDFASRATGGWCIAVNPGVPVSCSPDQVSSSNWVALTPEPGAGSLLGLGLVGIGLVRRRFKFWPA
ncbi:MAG: PEP-CTERM sorting domain-containing protein [Acidobacteriota bacterium]